MQRLKFKNSNGDEIEFSSYFPYLACNITGIHGAMALNSTNRGFQQDGSTHYSTLLEPRFISFTAYIQGESPADLFAKRSNMMSVFNSKLGLGTLTYYELANGTTIVERQIQCVVDGEIIDGGKKNPLTQAFTITLLAPNPAWESIILYQFKLAGFEGGFSIPFEFPIVLSEQGESAEIDYAGVLDAPLLIEFRGTASRPKVVKTETGEEIEIELDIAAGESLFVDTSPFKSDDFTIYKMVNGEKVDASNYVNPASDYFQLTKGVNTISFSAASGEPEVYISYRERYPSV